MVSMLLVIVTMAPLDGGEITLMEAGSSVPEVVMSLLRSNSTLPSTCVDFASDAITGAQPVELIVAVTGVRLLSHVPVVKVT